jgi:hypothetical protein
VNSIEHKLNDYKCHLFLSESEKAQLKKEIVFNSIVTVSFNMSGVLQYNKSCKNKVFDNFPKKTSFLQAEEKKKIFCLA